MNLTNELGTSQRPHRIPPSLTEGPKNLTKNLTKQLQAAHESSHDSHITLEQMLPPT
jgi:hypothetical protein